MKKIDIKNEDGFGTIEVVILLAIVVGIALIFKDSITAFVQTLINNIVNREYSLWWLNAFS